ncbi:unnamed protein product, partial [Meganyctiphanes norvegica]|uniref:Uncharacterized protein n=1 Tax=Meganyctiphanes norvegica TaxID=48144 RepID=A0AAV2PSU2_MEGNR
MKAVLIIFVYSVVILATNADGSPRKHSNKTNICMQCMCLTLQPYTVDCMNARYEELPPLTMNITYPWKLQLTHNKIRHIPQFPLLHNLIKLDLGRNGIKNIDEAAFANLYDLKGLVLAYNNLSAEILETHVFKGTNMLQPLGLEELDLSYNNLHSLEGHTLQYLPNLTKLHINNNPIHDIPYDMATAINTLENLEELDLSQCNLDRLPYHFLTDLRKLRKLTLAGNKLSIVPAEVNYAHSLTYLNLNGNPITTIMKGDFSEALRNVQELELSGMPVLRSVGPEAFSSLDHLAVLKMCDNPKLRSINMYAFTFFDLNRQLQEIYLQSNALTTLAEDMLPWTTLKVVDLQNNPWSCDCKLRWLAEDLIPLIERTNPSKTLSLICAEPDTDRGHKLTNIVGKPNAFSCDPPYIPKYTIYSPVAIAIIAVGITLMITSAIIFAYTLYRRTKVKSLLGETVRYRRAHSIDEDGYDEIVES